MTENLCFSDFFRGHRNGTFGYNRLNSDLHVYIKTECIGKLLSDEMCGKRAAFASSYRVKICHNSAKMMQK